MDVFLGDCMYFGYLLEPWLKLVKVVKYGTHVDQSMQPVHDMYCLQIMHVDKKEGIYFMYVVAYSQLTQLMPRSQLT